MQLWFRVRRQGSMLPPDRREPATVQCRVNFSRVVKWRLAEVKVQRGLPIICTHAVRAGAIGWGSLAGGFLGGSPDSNACSVWLAPGGWRAAAGARMPRMIKIKGIMARNMTA